MKLADPRKRLDVESQDVWENERTPTPGAVFRGSIHSMGLSVRDVEAVLKWLGVDHCHQAIWHWEEMLTETRRDPRTAEPSQVVVDEKRIRVDEYRRRFKATIL